MDHLIHLDEFNLLWEVARNAQCVSIKSFDNSIAMTLILMKNELFAEAGGFFLFSEMLMDSI